MLVAFKYMNTLLSALTDIEWNRFFVELPVKNIVMPVGLSFYVFQSSTYLSDVYRKGNQAERNIIRYAAFVAFFPTVLSGPIQKSRDLLPQLREPKDFDFDTARKGIILLVWGTFEKVCVSNRLLQVVNAVYDNYEQYIYDPCGTLYFIIAAVSFSLYIYADFSAYSDMARGISKMLMIDTSINFKNPYLSTSLTEFWTRWHATLNDWFVENVYIPLGGNRKGSVRKYLNVLVVFIISGAWHGSQAHFLVWGAINGLLVVAGQLLAPLKRNIYIGADERTKSIIWLKRLGVFFLITLTWVFFKNGTVVSLIIIKRMLFFNPIALLSPDVLSIYGTDVERLFTLLFVFAFCVFQWARRKEHEAYTGFSKQHMMFQCAALAAMICVISFTAFSSATTLNTEFLYFDF